MRKPIGKNYVRVKLGTRSYTYYCPGARVWSLIELPPNNFTRYPQDVEVVALGRRYFGRIKEARLLRF